MPLKEDAAAIKKILASSEVPVCTLLKDENGKPKDRSRLESYQVEFKRITESLYELTLQESDPKAELKTIRLNGVSADGLCIKLDNFGIHFFAAETGNTSCDYLVLTDYENEKYALFIELKTSIETSPSKGKLSLTNAGDQRKALQLNSGSARFDYLCSVVNKLRGSTVIQASTYERLFFVLYIHERNISPSQGSASLTGSCNFFHKEIAAIKVQDAQTMTVRDLIEAWNLVCQSSTSAGNKQ